MKLAALACALIAGCASSAPEPAPLRPGEAFSAADAEGRLTPGRSTKAEVRRALGDGVVIEFESGYEVWVYREKLPEKTQPPRTELVLLFAPSGILAKTRVVRRRHGLEPHALGNKTPRALMPRA